MQRSTPCLGLTALFFSELPIDREQAVMVCQSCPWCKICYERALARDERWGVWGGRVFGDQRSVPKPERVRGTNGHTNGHTITVRLSIHHKRV